MNTHLRPLAFLSAPYSDPDPAVVRDRIRRFCIKAAEIELGGDLHAVGALFNHMVQDHAELPLNYDFWRSYSLSLLSNCSILIVLMMTGWMDSVGVADEIAFASSRAIPVVYIDMPD